jgi:hypothetical protein
MLLDVTLVSGRRPELLARTLRSFQDKVFRNFTIASCHANIDPFCGTGTDRDACKEIILQYFPTANISTPHIPSFGKAVKTIWSRSRAPVIFHIEDDWLALESISPEHVEPLLSGSTRAVKPVAKEMRWNGRSPFYEAKRKSKIFGITYRRVKTSVFGTSPCFFDGDFVRTCAELMDPDLDPEKQMRPPHNPPLVSYLEQFRCRVLPGQNQTELIQDIGRDWRMKMGITKTVAAGKSVWSIAEQCTQP